MARPRSGQIVGTLREIWPLLPAALYLLTFLGIVLFYLIALTFSKVTDTGVIFPTLRTLGEVVVMPQFSEALVNTLLFALVGTPLELIVGLYLALLLYKWFPFRDTVRSVFMIPLAIPALVTAILLFILFDYPGGHVNHLLMGKYAFFPQVLHDPINWRSSKVFALGVSLVGKVWRDMPITMLIISGGLLSIDPELLDAAKSMGAGWRRQFQHVIVPLILPSISAVVLLRSIEMWKEFIFPFVLAGQHELLGTFIESLYNSWGNAHQSAAVALILVFCIVATSFLLFWLAEMLRRMVVEGGEHAKR